MKAAAAPSRLRRSRSDRRHCVRGDTEYPDISFFVTPAIPITPIPVAANGWMLPAGCDRRKAPTGKSASVQQNPQAAYYSMQLHGCAPLLTEDVVLNSRLATLFIRTKAVLRPSWSLIACIGCWYRVLTATANSLGQILFALGCALVLFIARILNEVIRNHNGFSSGTSLGN